MNPHDELKSLVDMFPSAQPLLAEVSHIPATTTPEPYQTLLVHHEHMTTAMERHHRCPMDVRVLQSSRDGSLYRREIVLLKAGTDKVVQYGLVRFNLDYVTDPVKQDILAEEIPLGRVLIDHNVLRHVDLGAILELTVGPRLAEIMRVPEGTVTYGRMATLFCQRQPAVDLLEVAAPEVA